jgi:purine-binding chemotaxis protein CheW
MAFQKQSARFVIFQLDERYFGVPLEYVQRVVRAAEVTPVPNSRLSVLGLLNIQGRIVCILDTRQLLGIPSREIELTDQYLVLKVSGREVGLMADEVMAVREYEASYITQSNDLTVESPFVLGVARSAEMVVFVLDAERIISLEDGMSIGVGRETGDLGRWP